MSSNSPQRCHTYDEIFSAFGDIGGARRHLAQLMVAELRNHVLYTSSNSSEKSVKRRLLESIHSKSIHSQSRMKRTSSEQLRQLAATTHSDLNRVCILIELQETELLEIKQVMKIRQAKDCLRQHGIVMQEDVRDRRAPLRPIEKIDVTEMPFKKVMHLQRCDIEAGTVYEFLESKNDPGKFKRYS